VFLLARSYPDTVPSLTYFSARDMDTLCEKCNFHHCRRSDQSILLCTFAYHSFQWRSVS